MSQLWIIPALIAFSFATHAQTSIWTSKHQEVLDKSEALLNEARQQQDIFYKKGFMSGEEERHVTKYFDQIYTLNAEVYGAITIQDATDNYNTKKVPTCTPTLITGLSPRNSAEAETMSSLTAKIAKARAMIDHALNHQIEKIRFHEFLFNHPETPASVKNDPKEIQRQKDLESQRRFLRQLQSQC